MFRCLDCGHPIGEVRVSLFVPTVAEPAVVVSSDAKLRCPKCKQPRLFKLLAGRVEKMS